MPAWTEVERGTKRIVLAWHRRAGKDDLCLHAMACRMVERVGNYWFMLPEASQARKAIWDAVDPHTGIKRIDAAFPPEIRRSMRNSDMHMELVNGSTFQVVGSDNYNSLVGSPPVGMVMSEYALSDPQAWAFMRPILKENGGWIIFNSTVRGPNHFKSLFDLAREGGEWFADLLPATKTDVFSAEALESERYEYDKQYGPHLGAALYNQEYLCDWSAAVLGAFYADLINAAEADERIGPVPYNPAKEVITGWDLGYGDATAIWCAQIVGREVRLVDCIVGAGVGLDWYVSELRERFSVFGEALLPHDAASGNVVSGKSAISVLRGFGLRCRIVPKVSVMDGINSARALIPQCAFDAKRCAHGLDALRQYRAEWDDHNRILKPTPVHDWASHPADGFRYLAVGLRDSRSTTASRPVIAPFVQSAWG
jgi:hypothetical protein